MPSPEVAPTPPAGPTAQQLFERYFWPHYPPDVRADPSRFRDEDANPAGNPALPAHLAEAAELFVAQSPALLGLDAPLTFDGAGVARLSKALDRARRDALLARADATSADGVLFNTVVHAAAYVGEVIVRAHGGAWSLRRPLWESVVVRAATSDAARAREAGAIAPFHWLLKHLDDRGIDDGPLGYRFKVHVELATAPVESLPVITVAKKLPDLKSPSYDLLVKYLHQHLPNLRDLGEGFLSPAEFTERRYLRLGFVPFFEGRALALHGQTPAEPATDKPSTIEVHWFTAAGWSHSNTFPCDESPPYFARATGPHLEVTLAWKGKPYTHAVGLRGHR